MENATFYHDPYHYCYLPRHGSLSLLNTDSSTFPNSSAHATYRYQHGDYLFRATTSPHAKDVTSVVPDLRSSRPGAAPDASYSKLESDVTDSVIAEIMRTLNFDTERRQCHMLTATGKVCTRTRSIVPCKLGDLLRPAIKNLLRGFRHQLMAPSGNYIAYPYQCQPPAARMPTFEVLRAALSVMDLTRCKWHGHTYLRRATDQPRMVIRAIVILMSAVANVLSEWQAKDRLKRFYVDTRSEAEYQTDVDRVKTGVNMAFIYDVLDPVCAYTLTGYCPPDDNARLTTFNLNGDHGIASNTALLVGEILELWPDLEPSRQSIATCISILHSMTPATTYVNHCMVAIYLRRLYAKAQGGSYVTSPCRPLAHWRPRLVAAWVLVGDYFHPTDLRRWLAVTGVSGHVELRAILDAFSAVLDSHQVTMDDINHWRTKAESEEWDQYHWGGS